LYRKVTVMLTGLDGIWDVRFWDVVTDEIGDGPVQEKGRDRDFVQVGVGDPLLEIRKSDG